MNFTLDKELSSLSIFLAKKSELGDRIDPEMVFFRRKTKNFKYPLAKLKSFFSEAPQYGAGERGLERENEKQPRYIRITDIDEYGILTNLLGATAVKVEPRYVLAEDDLLIARSGNTVGKAYLHKSSLTQNVCFFAGYLIRFRFRQDVILPSYVFALTQLPYYKEWVCAVQRAAGQPNINAKEYSNLEIPAAPLPVQRKIVSLLDEAYAAKRKNDQDADFFLASIDVMLLDELGVPNPCISSHSIEDRIFKRCFSSLSGKRIDPRANWKRLSFEGGRFALRQLRDVSSINPITRLPKIEKERLISFVPMDAVSDKFGEIHDTQAREMKLHGSYTLFQNGDVLWAKITPCMENGKSAVAKELLEGVGYGSTEFHVFRPITTIVSPEYLHLILRLKMLRELAQLNFTGSSGHQRVDEKYFYSMKIPIPSLEIQQNIVAKAESLKSQAKTLLSKGRADLDEAKRIIETFILENNVSKTA